MPHQVNLLDASLQRRRLSFDSATAVVAIVATLALSAALASTLQALAGSATDHAIAAEGELTGLQARVAALGPAAPTRASKELARLRAIEAGQRRMLAALDSRAAGESDRYSAYLLALARQAPGSLWLTGFSVAADNRSLEVTGRMTDPRQLPEYLRKLNAEPLFKGREFAQLSLKSVETPASANATAHPASGRAEFALRAVPGPVIPP